MAFDVASFTAVIGVEIICGPIMPFSNLQMLLYALVLLVPAVVVSLWLLRRR